MKKFSLLFCLSCSCYLCFSQPISSNIFYKIKAIHSNLFISVSANSMQSNIPVIQWSTPPGACEDGQAFKFIKTGDYYKIEVRNKNGKCLAINAAQKSAAVTMTDFDGSDTQLWKVEKNKNVYNIFSKVENLSLDVLGANTNAGAVLGVWDFVNATNQQFEITVAEEERPYWENLGSTINSSRTEMMPSISPDGKVMYFTRGNAVNGFVTNGDIFTATLNESGQWGNVRKVEALSNERHNGVVGFLPGGNSLLLFGDYTGGSALFSITQKTETGWSKPAPVKIHTPRLTQNLWSGTVGSDGKTILVELNTTGYLNESDMFVTFFEYGKWSELLNLGEVINKPGSWDGTPYLSADMKTLYFNSSRNNTGGTEVFMSKRLDDTWTNWSEPVKLDVSMYQDAVLQYYLVPGDGIYAYFVSGTKTFGEGDLFRMKLAKEVKPDPFLLVSGKTVDNKTAKPISASIVFEDLETGLRKGVLTSDPASGSYQIALPRGHHYGVYASAKGYYSITQNMDLKELGHYAEKNQDLLLAPLEIGDAVALNNVFFERGKDVLLSSSYPELDRLIKLLSENPSIQIELHGHTDNLGGVKENQVLSENRTKRVASYLAEHGIDKSRLTSKGFGGSIPLVPNTSEENRRKNRRVEFVIVKK